MDRPHNLFGTGVIPYGSKEGAHKKLHFGGDQIMKTALGTHGNIGLNAALVAASAGLLVAACSGGGDSGGAQYTQTTQGCAALVNVAGLPNSTTVISSATMNEATAASGNTPALSQHCEILGSINNRVRTLQKPRLKRRCAGLNQTCVRGQQTLVRLATQTIDLQNTH